MVMYLVSNLNNPMATPLLNESKFLRWNFDSHEEELTAKILPQGYKLFLYNERAILADRILALRYNPEKQMEFLQEDAALRGQLDYLEYLLSESAAAEQEVMRRVSQQNI